VYDQPNTESVHAQFDRVVDALALALEGLHCQTPAANAGPHAMTPG
jgi:hypothetical protein